MNERVNNLPALFRLIDAHQVAIRSLGVSRIGVFGSFVKNQVTDESDIDFLVEFEQGKKTFDHIVELSFLLETLTQRKIELVTPESLSKHIGPHILQEVTYVPLAA